jgi:hypothetical protein
VMRRFFTGGGSRQMREDAAVQVGTGEPKKPIKHQEIPFCSSGMPAGIKRVTYLWTGSLSLLQAHLYTTLYRRVFQGFPGPIFGVSLKQARDNRA